MFGRGRLRDAEIDEFYRANRSRLVDIARGRGARGQAEDAVQEAFAAVFKRWDTLDPEGRANYAVRCLTNQIKSWSGSASTRRERLTAAPGEPRWDPVNPVELAVAGSDLEVQVAYAIRWRLTATEAEVLLLAAEDEKTPEEIAEIRGVTAKSVRTVLASARRKLRQYLDEQREQE